MGLFDKFSTDVGIDLGTCNTLIYVKGRTKLRGNLWSKSWGE